ncbi:MAG: LON peptidase substrate-binding domain-containing protein [Burkholderiaceae bacterium]|jgi:Lon protease-like protein|nr:LON peptidase substrate-binding domain-containing protein [Burkholderiaceae bacterium]
MTDHSTDLPSSSDALQSLPLFPLGTVLFPQGLLSLRVFEVRYLDMVRKCERAGAPFGVVALQSGSEVRKAGAAAEQLHDMGTLARIVDLQQPQPGLLHLQCEGLQRFRITALRQLPHGLWVADVQLLPADAGVAIPAHLRGTAQALAQVLMQLHQRSSDADHARLPDAAQMADCGWVANRWIELLPLPMELKQRLMTLDSPLVRLELVADVLERSGIRHPPGS